MRLKIDESEKLDELFSEVESYSADFHAMVPGALGLQDKVSDRKNLLLKQLSARK